MVKDCRWYCLLVSCVPLLAAGCKKPPAVAALPPAEVSVATPLAESVMDSIEYPATIQALNTVEVRARVRGFLDRINFTPRQKVKQGDLLFVIDPRPFQVALEQAKAALEARQAELEFAKYEKGRIDALGANAAARERSESLAKLNTATASVAEAQAAVNEAQLNLDYSRVIAPARGRIGRNLVDVGNLINADQTTLATITDDDSVYAYMNVSEQDVLRLRRKYRTTQPVSPETQEETGQRPNDRGTVYLGLMDEKNFPHQGWIDFVDTRVDPKTGTITVRAVFPNSEGNLLPGFFGRIRVPLGEPRTALLVPERALGMDQGQRFLLVVNDQNVVEYRKVKVGVLRDEMRAIEEGIGAEDRVVIRGLQRARPGSTVVPHTAPITASRPAQTSTTSIAKR